MSQGQDRRARFLSFFRVDSGTERPGKQYLAFIQGMRGFAMLAIFLLHAVVQFSDAYFPPGSFTQKFASGVFTVVPAAVDLFFLISGYFMYSNLIQARRPLLPYLAGRLRRLYPVYLVMLLLYIALSAVFPTYSKIPLEPARATLYLLQNLLMLPGLFNIPALMAVSWIMSYLLFWTLALPVLINTLRMHTWKPGWRSTFWMAAAIASMVLYTRFGGPIRLISFIAGFLLFELLKAGYKKPLPPGAGLVTLPLMAVAIVLAGIERNGLALRMAVTFAGLFILCIDPFLRPGGLTERFFRWKPLVWVGNFSYSYFLTHGLILKGAGVLATTVFPPIQSPRDLIVFWLMPVIALPLTLLAGLLMYNLVERPFSSRKAPDPGLRQQKADTQVRP